MSTALKTVDAFVLDRCGALAGGGYTPYFVFVPDIKMMQPLVQRKPAFGQSIESTASPASYGRGMISKEKNEELKEGNSASKPSEKYDKLRNLLLCGMSIPLAVLFAYGGKNAILTLSFGALICFIFDLLGAIEATLLSVFLTLAILWVNLIYTSRFILKESILNISYSALFGTILFSAFLLISSYFHLFQIHFEFLCLKIHFFLLISLPALAAPILSWFLVHQFPDLDLSLCFSFIYFIYAFILHSNTSIRISSSQYLFIYTFPLLISPILYLSLHHNVLSSVRNHLLSLSTAFFFPLLIALYSFNESHLNSFSSSTRSQIKAFIPALKLIASVLLLISLQNHNFFTDLKIYSGYKEPFASLLLLSSFFFTSLAFHIDQHYVQSYILQLKEDITLDSNSRVARHLFVADIAENIAIIIASLAFGLLLRLPPSIFIFCILCVRINFFFSRSSFKNRRLARYLFTLGAASTAVSIVLSFSEDTLRTIQINFEGLFYSFGMNTFTRCSAGLVGLSVLLPSLMTIEPSPSPSSVPLGDLAPSSTVNSLRSSYFYDAILILFVAFASAMEVVVREQDWQDSAKVDIEAVYPSYLLLSTSFLSILTAALLSRFRSQEGFGILTLWAVAVISVMKLGSLLSISSINIASGTLLTLSYTIPPLFHVASMSSYKEIFTSFGLHHRITTSQIPSSSLSSTASLLLFLLSSFSTLIVSLWLALGPIFTSSSLSSYPSVLHQIIEFMQSRSPSTQQVMFTMLSMYFGYLGLLLLLTYPASSLRSVFLLLSLVCAVLATETIALFTSSNISSGENDSAAVLQLRPTEAGEHASFFLLLSSLQIILATSGLLPIRNPLPRLLFIITLTFCVTMGLYGVSFPSLLAYSTTDSLHAGFVYLNWMLSHGAWVHCLLLSFLCISTVLHLSSSSSTTTKHKNNKSALLIVFIIFLATPFVSILLAALAHGSPETLHRIAFSSSLTSAVLAFSVYFLSTFLRSKSLHPHTRSSLDAAMVSSLSSISCIFWASFYSLSSTHVNPDFIIPLSTTTLFTIPRGHLLPNPRHHPFATVLLASSLWWTLSALYSITLKGIRGSAESPMIPTHTPYQDSPVSFWNQPSTFLSLLNVFFVLVPLPSICTSFLGRSGESEDVAFIMAVFCTLSLFGGQIWSIRLLGAAGSVYGFWHCYDLSLLQQKSNALL